eukprot:scaffold226887_cov31-Prasinocladus_malaysianus.AAC.1
MKPPKVIFVGLSPSAPSRTGPGAQVPRAGGAGDRGDRGGCSDADLIDVGVREKCGHTAEMDEYLSATRKMMECVHKQYKLDESSAKLSYEMSRVRKEIRDGRDMPTKKLVDDIAALADKLEKHKVEQSEASCAADKCFK